MSAKSCNFAPNFNDYERYKEYRKRDDAHLLQVQSLVLLHGQHACGNPFTLLRCK